MVEYDSKSWLRVILSFRGSVVPALAVRVLLCVAIGIGASLLYHHHQFHISPIVHTLIGAALGLLLVFRTNASYDRFWEGRRMLGALVNRTRDLARQIVSYVEGDDAETRATKRDLVRHINLLYALIRQYLRKERDLAVLGELCTAEERAQLEPIAVRPTLAYTWISRRAAALARAGKLSEQRLQLIDGNLTSFADSWGACERIMKTPLPFAYAQHIKLFLTLFVFTAPFVMVESMGWYTAAATAVLGFGLFGIDEIGVEIEDPFGHDPNDLPLDRIGEVIGNDTRAIVESQ